MMQVFFKRAFTLVELLVSMAIISLTIGLSLCGVQKIRASAARMKCASNLRQIGLGIHHYEALRQLLPEGCQYPFARTIRQRDSQSGISWLTLILPAIEQSALWEKVWAAHRQAPTGKSLEHKWIEQQVIATFMCPADSQPIGQLVNASGVTAWANTSYRGIKGTGDFRRDGIFHSAIAFRLLQITDGTSQTVMIGERPAGPSGAYGAWYASEGDGTCEFAQLQTASDYNFASNWAPACPRYGNPLRPGRADVACDIGHFWSEHTGGAHFAFADGSVRFLRYSASDILPALATRARGEVVTIPD